MAQIEHTLLEVDSLLALGVHAEKAETLMTSLIETLADEELRRWEVDIRKAIAAFLPRRQKRLTALLEARFGAPLGIDAVTEPVGHLIDQPVEQFEARLRSAFSVLSEKHIFQWTTEYRDSLLPLLAYASSGHHSGDASAKLVEIVRAEFTSHTNEIFSKGYRHVRQSNLSHDFALSKSSTGLRRFLELPIEFHSTQVIRDVQGKLATALRAVVSAALSGILIGYSSVSFGAEDGQETLGRLIRSWCHYLPFLVAADLRMVLSHLESLPLTEQIADKVLPVIAAIDDLHARETDDRPMPLVGQFFREQSRLEVSIRPPLQSETPDPLDVICFLDTDAITTISLQEAANRNVAVVVADLRPELKEFALNNASLKPALVSPAESRGQFPITRQSIRDRLEYELYRKRSLLVGATPISHNFARYFPLQNPFLTQYFRVRRLSVAALLKTFERRNGVRLWCSVRRSGKTTSCFDLGASREGTKVVSQTCDSTELTPDSNLFYDAVRQAINDGRDLQRDFVQATVERCSSDASKSKNDRYVFVLDEYETLFGRLKAAAKDNPSLRYTVVQPLLNQIVAFSRDNLVVFLGQQPDAHFILMDQNQLSGAVEYDAFPLFTHGVDDLSGEFRELVSRVMTPRVVSHPSFLDAVFEETSGHPFLTVKVLVDFVDWLIAHKRKLGDLRFDGDDFVRFSEQQLNRQKIAGNPEYAFFREAISQAISADGRAENQWLHSVYRIIRHIATQSPQSLRLSVGDVTRFVEGMREEGIEIDADVILPAAARANFIRIDAGWVSPRIRVLGRIAATCRSMIR